MALSVRLKEPCSFCLWEIGKNVMRFLFFGIFPSAFGFLYRGLFWLRGGGWFCWRFSAAFTADAVMEGFSSGLNAGAGGRGKLYGDDIPWSSVPEPFAGVLMTAGWDFYCGGNAIGGKGGFR